MKNIKLLFDSRSLSQVEMKINKITNNNLPYQQVAKYNVIIHLYANNLNDTVLNSELREIL